LSLHNAIFLFFAGALGGAINAVAGGGSFVSFPALLFTGVPPVPANAKNTLALWVGTTASGGVINGVATLTFIATRVILWPQGIVMTVGAILGGYSSAHYAQELPQPWVRLCHFGGERHNDLLFHPRLSLEVTEECAKHIDFLLSVTTFDIVRLL